MFVMKGSAALRTKDQHTCIHYHWSKVYGDGLHLVLEKKLSLDWNLTVPFHRNYVNRYTTESILAKFEKKMILLNQPKLLCSYSPFDFKQIAYTVMSYVFLKRTQKILKDGELLICAGLHIQFMNRNLLNSFYWKMWCPWWHLGKWDQQGSR